MPLLRVETCQMHELVYAGLRDTQRSQQADLHGNDEDLRLDRTWLIATL